jgi:hypothetical protein
METYFVGSWFKALAATEMALSLSSKGPFGSSHFEGIEIYLIN